MNIKLVKVYHFTEKKQYIIILLFKINNIYGTTDKTTETYKYILWFLKQELEDSKVKP